MNYNSYYEKLIDKNREKKSDFLNNHVFGHRDGKYHATNYPLGRGNSVNFVISSSYSIAFGEGDGIVVELYITDSRYFQSYFNQLKQYKNNIERDLGVENIFWQSAEETQSGNVCRVYAKKIVDLEDESKWDEYIEWQINTMIKFLEILPKYIDKLEDI